MNELMDGWNRGRGQLFTKGSDPGPRHSNTPCAHRQADLLTFNLFWCYSSHSAIFRLIKMLQALWTYWLWKWYTPPLPLARWLKIVQIPFSFTPKATRNQKGHKVDFFFKSPRLFSAVDGDTNGQSPITKTDAFTLFSEITRRNNLDDFLNVDWFALCWQTESLALFLRRPRSSFKTDSVHSRILTYVLF